MSVFALINREVPIQKKKLAVLACISGLSNAMVLAVINVAAAHVSEENNTLTPLYYLAIFILIIAIYVLSQRRLMYHATHYVEESINHLRKHLVQRLRHCELVTIENIGKEQIYSVISKELQTISQAAQLFVIAGQAAILVVFTAFYIAWLSLTAFLIISIFMAIGATIHLKRASEVKRQLAIAFNKENELVTHVSDLLEGFKEVKLNQLRADQLQADIDNDSLLVTNARQKTQNLFSTDFVLSQTTFFIATGAMVFLVPVFSHVYPDVVIKVTTASLFVIGPISNIVGGIPIYANANAAAENVIRLEELLEDEEEEDKTPSEVQQVNSFQEIKLEQLFFKYLGSEGDRPFEVGPVNITINQGQTIFVTGGNGSGKTTFIRLLTGLYPAHEGHIRLDGKIIDRHNLNRYRSLFTSVFSDFHLFSRLYGIPEYSSHEAEHWLRFLEMDHKVQIHDNKFSTVDLSGGQRKRLALFSSILEKRPVFIFDEWAADQDPHFRHKFYHEILPKLKADMHTVIAITHDDKYFEFADVHMKMADGQINIVKHKPPHSA
jgi:putative ATP-binding cassette transporter